MDVVVLVEGREAIPVRAIPLLTDWQWMSPDVLAAVLAADEDTEHLKGLKAYRLGDGGISEVKKTWWHNYCEEDLKALSKRLHASSDSPDVTRPVWRHESLKILPAGVFVWKDEYQGLYQRDWERHLRAHVPPHEEDDYGFDDAAELLAAQRRLLAEIEDRRDLNFFPLRSYPDQERIVMEGFSESASPPELAMSMGPPVGDNGAQRIRKHRESSEERQARRYRMCIDNGVTPPTREGAHFPRGVSRVAAMEKISRQSFTQDVRKHVDRLRATASGRER
jgi:hypothetical protein